MVGPRYFFSALEAHADDVTARHAIEDATGIKILAAALQATNVWRDVLWRPQVVLTQEALLLTTRRRTTNCRTTRPTTDLFHFSLLLPQQRIHELCFHCLGTCLLQHLADSRLQQDCLITDVTQDVHCNLGVLHFHLQQLCVVILLVKQGTINSEEQRHP